MGDRASCLGIRIEVWLQRRNVYPSALLCANLFVNYGRRLVQIAAGARTH